MRRIAYADTSGYVIVVTPAYADQLRDPAQSDAELLKFVLNKDVPQGVESLVIDDTNPRVRRVLEDRSRRDQWKLADFRQ